MTYRLPWKYRVVCAAVALALCLIVASASGSTTVEISPPMVEVTAEPGSESSFEVMLSNPGLTSQLHLKVFLAPVDEKRDGSYNLVEKEGPWSALPWLQLTTDKLSIPPGRSQTVVVKVKIPRGSSGSRVAAVAFEIVPDAVAVQRSDEAMGGTTQYRNLLLTVVKLTAQSRANRKEATISGISVTTAASDTSLLKYGKRALRVACPVVNEGNVLFVATGRLLIRDVNRRRVKDIPLGAGRGVVIPGATVELTSILPQGLPPGEYSAEATIGYGGPGPLRTTLPFTVTDQSVSADGAHVDAVRVTTNPGRIETQLPAGAFRGFNLTLANLDKSPVAVKGAVREVGTNRLGEFEIKEEGGGAWSAAGWIGLSQETVRLEPGERKNIRVTVAVPKDIKDGTRYAAVTLDAERDGGGNAGAVTTLLIPAIVQTGKGVIRKAVLESPGVAMSENPLGLVIGAKLMNMGNTHLEYSGRILLQRKASSNKNVEGLEVLGGDRFEDLATVPISGSGLILPGASSPVIILYDKPLEPGEYQAVFLVEYGAEAPLSVSVPFLLAPEGTVPGAPPAGGASGGSGTPKK